MTNGMIADFCGKDKNEVGMVNGIAAIK